METMINTTKATTADREGRGAISDVFSEILAITIQQLKWRMKIAPHIKRQFDRRFF
jgi:hypothetical protein